jgi:hypothetical protein
MEETDLVVQAHVVHLVDLDFPYPSLRDELADLSEPERRRRSVSVYSRRSILGTLREERREGVDGSGLSAWLSGGRVVLKVGVVGEWLDVSGECKRPVSPSCSEEKKREETYLE